MNRPGPSVALVSTSTAPPLPSLSPAHGTRKPTDQAKRRASRFFPGSWSLLRAARARPGSIDAPVPPAPASPIRERRPSVPIVVRPRHVPIVIPPHACPFGPLPDPKVSLECDFSRLYSFSIASLRQYPAMSRPTTSASHASTVDSATSASPAPPYGSLSRDGLVPHPSDLDSHAPGTNRGNVPDAAREHDGAGPTRDAAKGPGLSSQPAAPSPAVSQQTPSAAATSAASNSTALSGLVCNVHRTTGREPHPLVGATTTILGDKLYVFGGRVLSRTRPQLTNDLFELDLVRRHWTRIDTRGNIPAPRYFHSVCALGDTKLVCYGGMSPAASLPSGPSTGGSTTQAPGSGQDQPEVVVMSDIHIYDVVTRTWTYISTHDTPQGRYAHCATILPSSAVFTSATAHSSAIHHNPASSTGNPNQGSIGVALDGAGGAEMVVVGGQDSANHYIEQISVFNLRSLRWIATDPLGKSCGAYRSVVAPLTGMSASRIGRGPGSKGGPTDGKRRDGAEGREAGSSLLIYSNYNFLDVKLELQVRLPDGSLSEKPMRGDFSPPGLRFPNGGVIDRHLVISGTYLTSSKQEYALWALDLNTLTWSRIDAGGNHFSQGSWNRGVLWTRRNTFVVLGNRKRSLVEDYNHRRINFSNVCMVELEAFGMYDNPRKTTPTSAFVSASSPAPAPLAALREKATWLSNGRPQSVAAEELGKMMMGYRELADMSLLAMGGERIPVNSHIVAQRWGPYFIQILREGAAGGDNEEGGGHRRGMENGPSRNSSVTITPSIGASSTSTATATTLPVSQTSNGRRPSNNDFFSSPTVQSLGPATRPRTLYLPHTHSTLQTLVHYLYTSSLPPPHHPLCTPQILCSLLQIARPYQIDGLLEAVVERLHQVLDGRNAAAVFNAAAMAAGGGQSTTTGTRGAGIGPRPLLRGDTISDDSTVAETSRSSLTASTRLPVPSTATASAPSEDESDVSSVTSASVSTNTTGSEVDLSDGGAGRNVGAEREIWAGELSSVVGLQKRGLRGLMEGRRIRERGKSVGASTTSIPSAIERSQDRVGLGIAG
ncbi:MAG: hypothetical protein M1838_000861 [Thelocarpon superellum]|nr:MAG: hypothetical protein M1838_000861 [Thelocarpon superellum]